MRGRFAGAPRASTARHNVTKAARRAPRLQQRLHELARAAAPAAASPRRLERRAVAAGRRAPYEISQGDTSPTHPPRAAPSRPTRRAFLDRRPNSAPPSSLDPARAPPLVAELPPRLPRQRQRRRDQAHRARRGMGSVAWPPRRRWRRQPASLQPGLSAAAPPPRRGARGAQIWVRRLRRAHAPATTHQSAQASPPASPHLDAARRRRAWGPALSLGRLRVHGVGDRE